MIVSILQGAVLGLGLSVLLGPVLFMLIETSANYGIKQAFYLDIGVITSDMVCVSIVYFGLSQFFESTIFKKYLFIVGGFIFIVFGLSKFFSNPKRKFKEFGKRLSFRQLYFRGFFFNILNPGVIFFWIAAVAFVLSSFDNRANILAYFLATFFTVMLFDFLKILGASVLKKWLKPKRLFRMGQIIGIVFIVFGIVLLIKPFFQLKLP